MSYDKASCEEFYTDPQTLQLAMGSRKGKTTTFISPNLFIVALEVNGVMVKSVGAVVKAEIIEMNCVKVVTSKGEELFYELGEDVRWMEVGEHE